MEGGGTSSFPSIPKEIGFPPAFQRFFLGGREDHFEEGRSQFERRNFRFVQKVKLPLNRSYGSGNHPKSEKTKKDAKGERERRREGEGKGIKRNKKKIDKTHNGRKMM